MKVWIDGRIVEPSEAKIPVTDHGLLYGDGIFEGIRAYDRKVFRLDDHMRRFASSARAIGLQLPLGLPEIAKVVLETCRAFDHDDVYLRLIATRGEGSLGVDPTTCEHPRLFCIAADVEIFPSERIEAGIDMVTVSVRRPALDALDPRVKSLNYMNSVLAKREARLRGADEALILNAAGAVAEASVANIFVARAGVLSTPPTTDGSLDGIMRESTLEMAETLGIPAREQTLSRLDLLRADEVFLTGTGARIVPVASLDDQSLGWDDLPAGRRPITSALLEAFPAWAQARGTPF